MGDALTRCLIPHSSSYPILHAPFQSPGQEGTLSLWWHTGTRTGTAHSFLRATLYGAFIVRPPRSGNAYPFLAPDREAPFVLGNRCCTVHSGVWTAAWHCRPRRSCEADSSLGADTKKNPMFLVSASLDEVVMNRRVVEPEYWLTSRAMSSCTVSFPPSPTRSQLTAKPACCTSAQIRVHRVIHHCEIVNCCSTFLSLIAI
jgi:hypothetical protein